MIYQVFEVNKGLRADCTAPPSFPQDEEGGRGTKAPTNIVDVSL